MTNKITKFFQLPLSGSLYDTGTTAGAIITFNSLSRDHRAGFPGRAHLTFPIFQLPLSGSLAVPGIPEANVQVVDFQLPLSGSQILAPFLLKVAKGDLSTPSLGITEPDSGIFRLSAAFCRGPLSHE